MAKGDCTPDNVAGDILADMEADGHLLDDAGLEQLGESGKATFFEKTNLKDAEAFDISQESWGDETDQMHADMDDIVDKDWSASGFGDNVKGMLNSFRDPSGVLGYDIVQPVLDLQEALHSGDIVAKEYNQQAKAIFKELDFDVEGLSSAQRAYYERFKNDYKTAGALAPPSNPAGKAILKAADNTMTNLIISSHRVILGNIFEGAMKLPSHYPSTFIPALAKMIMEGPWKRHPELEAKGVYGYAFEGEKGPTEPKGTWQGLVGLSDIPFKNAAYFAGEMAHGDGARAVQEIAFSSRPGNTPEIFRHATTRPIVKLAGFTINSYKMQANMINEFVHGHPQKLVAYLAMAGILGGLDNLIKDQFENPDRDKVESFLEGAKVGAIKSNIITAPASWILEAANPDAKEWFHENSGYLNNIFSLNPLGGIFAGADIVKSSMRHVTTYAQKGMTHIEDGDYTDAAISFGDATLGGLSFTRGVGPGIIRTATGAAADAGVQKAYRFGRDVFQMEMDSEDIPGYFQQKYFRRD